MSHSTNYETGMYSAIQYLLLLNTDTEIQGHRDTETETEETETNLSRP